METKSKQYYINKIKLSKMTSAKDRYIKVLMSYNYKGIKELKKEGVDMNKIVQDHKNGMPIEDVLNKYKIRYHSFLYICRLLGGKKSTNKQSIFLENIDEIRSIVEEGDKEKIKKMIQTLSKLNGEYPSKTKIYIGRLLFKSDHPKELDVFKRNNLLPDNEKNRLKEYRKTHTVRETAKKFNISTGTVHNIMYDKYTARAKKK